MSHQVHPGCNLKGSSLYGDYCCLLFKLESIMHTHAHMAVHLPLPALNSQSGATFDYKYLEAIISHRQWFLTQARLPSEKIICNSAHAQNLINIAIQFLVNLNFLTAHYPDPTADSLCCWSFLY